MEFEEYLIRLMESSLVSCLDNCILFKFLNCYFKFLMFKF